MNQTPLNPEEHLPEPFAQSVSEDLLRVDSVETADTAPAEFPLPAAAPVAEDIPLFQYGNVPSAPAAATEENGGLSKGSKLLLWLMFLAIVGFSVFCIVWDIQKGSQGGGYIAGDVINVQIGQQKKPDQDPVYMDENGKYTYEGIVQTVMPSIVQIYTYYDGVIAGSGSGIIITVDGYVVTNAHVVSAGDSFSVTLHDNTVYDAERVGYDSKTDIAVLKIEADDLQPAVLGDSDETLLGEEVCALGCPAGFSGSISTGIVSGLHRKVRTESDTYEMDCIQTDAAISPGNSGGALVNLYGQVIGITSSKYVSGSFFDIGSYEGLGFAITINEALPIISDLVKQGYVSGRVRVGIQFYEAEVVPYETDLELPPELKGVGVYIMAIDETMPIAQTELQVGDFIVELEGAEVVDYTTLNATLEGKQGGDIVTAKCARLDEDGNVSYFDIEFALVADTSGDY